MLNLILLSLLGAGLTWGLGAIALGEDDSGEAQTTADLPFLVPPEIEPDDPLAPLPMQKITLSYDAAEGVPTVTITEEGNDALIALNGTAAVRVALGAGQVALHNVTLVGYRSAPLKSEAPMVSLPNPVTQPARRAAPRTASRTTPRAPPITVVRNFDCAEDVLIFHYCTAAPPKLSVTASGKDALLRADGHHTVRILRQRDHFTIEMVVLIPSA